MASESPRQQYSTPAANLPKRISRKQTSSLTPEIQATVGFADLRAHWTRRTLIIRVKDDETWPDVNDVNDVAKRAAIPNTNMPLKKITQKQQPQAEQKRYHRVHSVSECTRAKQNVGGEEHSGVIEVSKSRISIESDECVFRSGSDNFFTTWLCLSCLGLEWWVCLFLYWVC